jgi:ribosomal protein S18 acetylase RimI-like enzyme
MTYRNATPDDAVMLGELNLQLVQDQRHRYASKPLPFFQDRMRGFLVGEYRGVIFEDRGEVVAYALYRDYGEDGVYIRQLFVARHRRREGIGRVAMQTLIGEVLPARRRITLEVLTGNAPAFALYRAMGFREYCSTLELMR